MTTFSPRIPRARQRSSSRFYGRAERRTGRESRLVWGGFALVAAAALAFLMWTGAGNTFFYDDWSWILGRGGLHWVLASYNEHLQVAPKAVYLLLFHTIGIGQYWPYRLLAALAHLACVAAIFAYALRRLGPMALLIAIPIAVFGAGAEFILWGNIFGFPASMALSVAALLWLDHDDRRGDVMACVLLTLGLVFSETALLFAAGVAVELTWRDRGVRRAWIWAIPAALYAAWWVACYQPYLSEHDYGAIPYFVARLAVHAAGGLFGLGAAGGSAVLVIVVAALAFLVLRRGVLGPRLVGLGVTLVLFWCLVAFSRAELNQPGASKYVYTGSLLLVLILVEALRGVARTPQAWLAVAVLSALSLVGNLHAFGPEEAWLHTGSRTGGRGARSA